MKILHTSDWHIGKRLYDKSIDETLEYFFMWLKQTIIEEQIDVLLVCGDVFNNPYPSQSSLKLYYRTLFELSTTNLQQIIITGGNHDSVSNLNAPKELLSILNIKVVGGVSDNIEDLIVEIKDKNKQTQLVVAAVPFLRERDIRLSEIGQTYADRVEMISKGIQNFYTEIAQKLEIYKQKNIPIVGMGHLYINDLHELEDEEKERIVGGLQQISYKQIPDIFDYFALGHIHKAMKVGKNENVRYCGSPVFMSFSEIKNKNQVVLVDFENNELEIRKIFVPIFRDLLHFKGSLKEISEEIKNYQNTKELIAWVDIEIIEVKKDLLLDNKIQNLKDNYKNVEIIQSRYTFTDIQEEIEKKFEQNTNLKDLKPIQIFDKMLDDSNEDDKDELRKTFLELVQNHLN